MEYGKAIHNHTGRGPADETRLVAQLQLQEG
jgi:hypothetical protein